MTDPSDNARALSAHIQKWQEHDEPVDVYVSCRRCGAYVYTYDKAVHEDFHERIGDAL